MTEAAAADPDCLFCKIIRGDIPSRRVDEDEQAYAFLDIAPFQRGHTLVIPKRHVESLVAEPPAMAEISPLVERVSRRLVQRLGADGLNLLSSAGAVAGQEVFHFHIHLVPRYASAPGLRSLFDAKPAAGDSELDAVHREITGP
jgi:histidine triad (HIT) family protein